MLKLDPGISRQVIIRALTHDQGEACTGDLPYTFKRENPEIRKVVSVVEDSCTQDQGFSTPKLSEYESVLLKVSDWVDSYLWARHHEPDMVAKSHAWQEQLINTTNLADKYHFSDRLYRVLEDSRHE